jgi:hypothetical protein
MRRELVLAAALLAPAAFAAPSFATVYNDATNDLHNGAGGGTDYTGFQHLNISSVEVTNDATNVTFKITLAGDIAATNWGKYMVALDTKSGGDTTSNGWTRPISMPSGMDYWVGSWVDQNPDSFRQLWTYSGSWSQTNQTAVTRAQFSTTFTVALADLGLVDGSTFSFDVYSSGGGGGDSAVDALSRSTPSITDWGNPFSSTGTLPSYTVVIPEPATAGLALLGGLGLIGRRRSAVRA